MSLENNNLIKISNTINNPYIDEWKSSGKKVIGHYCTYVPDELLYAGDFLPFRIRATGYKNTDLGDTYMVRFTCSFVRMTLNVGLKGGYDFLDGLFMSNCCDHARRMYELFDLRVFTRKEFKDKPHVFYTSLPNIITKNGFEYYLNEIRKFKLELEEKFKIERITDNQLNTSINIYNKNRILLREIQKLRKLDVPKLSGSESLQISMANSSIPKEIANQELEKLLQLLKEREGIKSNKKRLMVIGSVIDNTSFTEVIENSGGEIITDSLCFGNRTIQEDVEINTGIPPLEAIVKRVYYRLSCPRMMKDYERRLAFIKKEISDAKIDGVILQRINNCDLHGCENMNLQHQLKEELDIPIFSLDRENFQADYNRLQTRIEAFMEMM